MNFDIRVPIGAMFSILGLLLVGYGLISDVEIYRRSFDINVNLIWGGVMLLFGGTMLLLGRRSARKKATPVASVPTAVIAPEHR
jgi:hypothetical protein